TACCAARSPRRSTAARCRTCCSRSGAGDNLSGTGTRPSPTAQITRPAQPEAAMSSLLTLAALTLAAAPAPNDPAEPWADRGLPVRGGLVLGLAAGRQREAHEANEVPPPLPNSLVGVCYDGSGNRLNLVQRLQAAQPRFVASGKHAALRFDGKSAHLGL